MRSNYWYTILLLLLNSHFASVSVSLLQPKSLAYEKNIIAQAEHSGLNRVELDKSQTFDVVKDGKLQGTLIQGKGWIREVQPVCFIGWSKDGKNIIFRLTGRFAKLYVNLDRVTARLVEVSRWSMSS